MFSIFKPMFKIRGMNDWIKSNTTGKTLLFILCILRNGIM